MYSDRSGLILGFHGCDESVRDKVVLKQEDLKFSTNDYDWLGSGIYFWANSPDRALEYASEPRRSSKIQKPSVLGAVLDLKCCLDLTEHKNLRIVKDTYDLLSDIMKSAKYKMPTNIRDKTNNELLLRKLDCFVIESVHKLKTDITYDSVMSVFLEGNELYENAGFRQKNHIQICVRNPNCIKGYFIPREKV